LLVFAPVLQMFNVVLRKELAAMLMDEVVSAFQTLNALVQLSLVSALVLLTFNAVSLKLLHQVLLKVFVAATLVTL